MGKLKQLLHTARLYMQEIHAVYLYVLKYIVLKSYVLQAEIIIALNLCPLFIHILMFAIWFLIGC